MHDRCINKFYIYRIIIGIKNALRFNLRDAIFQNFLRGMSTDLLVLAYFACMRALLTMTFLIHIKLLRPWHQKWYGYMPLYF